MRLSRRRSALLAGGAAIALLTGCTSEPSPPKALTAVPSPTPPNIAAAFRAAGMQTEAQKAARYSLMTATKINGAEVVFSGEGIYDWSTDTGRITYETPGGEVQQRVLGTHVYLALPQQPNVFFDVPTAALAASPVGGTVDPAAQLHLLAAVSEAEVVGSEQVRGVPTTRYRGTYDVARAIRGAQGVQQPVLRSLLGAAAESRQAPYDVFLDRDGLLRRLQQTIEVPPSAKTNGQPLTVTTTLDLYDFGIDVRVGRPADSTVRDGAPLLAALRQALPKPSAAPTPPPSPGATPLPSAPVSPPVTGGVATPR